MKYFKIEFYIDTKVKLPFLCIYMLPDDSIEKIKSILYFLASLHFHLKNKKRYGITEKLRQTMISAILAAILIISFI